MSGANLMLAALLIPLAAAVLIPLADRRPNLREAITLSAALLLAVTVYALAPRVLEGERPALDGFAILPGIELRFALEPLGMIFALVAGSLWLFNSLYSIGYMRGNDEAHQTSFYAWFAVALSATMGIAFAANLVTLFLFYEVLTLTTFPLVAHKRDAESKRSGRTYLGVLMFGSMFLMLPAIIWVYQSTGGGDFRPGGVLAGHMSVAETAILLALFVFGTAKAAVMPMHRWLPAAMVAPTPVSALLHAVAVVKAGVFTIVKIIVYIFGPATLMTSGAADWLVYVAGFTVVAASLVALVQDNLKRRLAYSTISQLSYIVLAAAMAAPVAIMAAALHIAAHALAKITLFFAAGGIYTAEHKTKVSELAGIGRRMPWTMSAFTVGAVSMIGVPPTAGFISKWFILDAAASTAQIFVLAVMVLSTLLNMAYFAPIVYSAFFGKPDGRTDAGPVGEAPWPCVVAVCATALGTVAMFLFPGLPFGLAQLLAGR